MAVSVARKVFDEVASGPDPKFVAAARAIADRAMAILESEEEMRARTERQPDGQVHAILIPSSDANLDVRGMAVKLVEARKPKDVLVVNCINGIMAIPR